MYFKKLRNFGKMERMEKVQDDTDDPFWNFDSNDNENVDHNFDLFERPEFSHYNDSAIEESQQNDRHHVRQLHQQQQLCRVGSIHPSGFSKVGGNCSISCVDN